jgi:hypothetical protein
MFAIALAITAFVYQRGLFGTFALDDYHNITNNPPLAIGNLNFDTLKQAALSSASGPLGRPITMLSFAANHYVSGFDPFPFKVTNLVIHMINGVGIFLLTSLLLRVYRERFQPELSLTYTHWVSVAVAGAWLLHPFNLTSVLYVVQRMTSLSAFFSIWGLFLFLWGRARVYHGKSFGFAAILASLFVFTSLAALSKENGALLPLLMFLIEITLFNFQTNIRSVRGFLAGLYVLSLALPAVAGFVYTLVHPEWLMQGYQARDFTLSERLMTEGRVMWFYMKQIILPSVGEMSLYHDDIAISHTLLKPVSTVFSLAALLGLTFAALFVRKRAPLIAFGLLFFLSGHVVESTIVPLEIAYEHRNYFPMYGILLILFFYILYPLNYANTLRLRHVVAILLISLFSFNTYIRADKWSNPFDLALSEVVNHPDSLRANAEMANVYSGLTSKDPKNMEAYYLSARHYYETMSRIDTDDIHGLIGLIILNGTRGKAIEPSWTSALKNRLGYAPIPVNIGHKLEGLISCRIKNLCKLTNIELEEFLQAALHNPNLTALKRAAILSALSYYLVNVAQDYPLALNVMRQTVDAAPWVIEYRLTLISFLSTFERFSEAKKELAIARQLDRLQVHTANIELQNELLSKKAK